MDFSNRSKQHSNQIHKNQQQKSQQKSPVLEQSTTSTTKRVPTPSTTPNSRIPDNLHTEILFTVTPKSHTSSLPTLYRQRQKTSSLGASSLQSKDDVETISDESQNIQVTQHRDHITPASLSPNYRTNVIVHRHKEAFATSPRPNLLRESSEKVFRQKSSLDSGKSYESFKGSDEYANLSTEKSQIKNLQTYVLSDVKPQSFKPAPVFEIEEYETDEISKSIEKEYSSPSTTLHNLALLEPKPFQYSLKTGTNGFNLQIETREKELDMEKNSYHSKPSTQIFTTTTFRSPSTSALYTTTSKTTTTHLPTKTTKKPTSTPVISTTSSFNNSEPFYIDEFSPTTLIPSTRFLKNSRPTVRTNSQRLQATPSTIIRDTVLVDTNPPPTTQTMSTTTTTTTTTTERPIQSFTARATLFKDNLVRTTANPAQRFVSPYKSLENLLGEQDKNLRTTSKPRYTSPSSTPTPFLMSTKPPLRSYFVITSAPKVLTDALATMSTNARKISISDTILTTFSNITLRSTSPIHSTTESIQQKDDTKPTTTTPTSTVVPRSTSIFPSTTTMIQEPITTTTSKYKLKESSGELLRQRGRSRYSATTKPFNGSSDETDTNASITRSNYPESSLEIGTTKSNKPNRRKLQRARIVVVHGQQPRYLSNVDKSKEKYQSYKAEQRSRDSVGHLSKSQNRKSIENEYAVSEGPRAEALVAFPLEINQDNSIEGTREESKSGSRSSTDQVVAITDRPLKQFYSNKYRQKTIEHSLAEGLQNAGYITSSTGRSKYRQKSVLEQLQEFLAGDSEENTSGQKDFEENFTHPEIKAAVQEIKNLYTSSTWKSTITTTTPSSTTSITPSTTENTHTTTRYTTSTLSQIPRYISSTSSGNLTSSSVHPTNIPIITSSNSPTSTTKVSSLLMPMRASRVNNAIKSSIAAAAASSSYSALNQGQATSVTSPMSRNHKVISPTINSHVAAGVKCSDSTTNAKCNEIPSRYLLFVITSFRNFFSLALTANSLFWLTEYYILKKLKKTNFIFINAQL